MCLVLGARVAPEDGEQGRILGVRLGFEGYPCKSMIPNIQIQTFHSPVQGDDVRQGDLSDSEQTQTQVLVSVPSKESQDSWSRH